MIEYYKLGNLPPKPHTAFYGDDGALRIEQCVTREGFEGAFSTLYFKQPPTDETRVESTSIAGFCPFELIGEQRLHRRHVMTQSLSSSGDFLTGRKTLFVNSTLQVGVIKPNEKPERFFANADGDECYFVKEGHGFLESTYGILPFLEHDYVIVPKSTPYRMHFEGNQGTALVFEGKPKIGVPSDYRNNWGQISMYAPYTHRDFRKPERLLSYDKAIHGEAPFPLVTKFCDELTVHTFDHFPHEVEGWDGFLYPVAFSIHDYQPKTGLIHLPPTIHTTFSGEGFVICSFVPRQVDYHKKAIPCPYGHASVDMDEILYYVDGNFTSRKGINSESISLHPQGVPHGPHPGTYERSIGLSKTNELAVMCDSYKPFRLTAIAAGIEDADYHMTWVEKESS